MGINNLKSEPYIINAPLSPIQQYKILMYFIHDQSDEGHVYY